VGIRIRNKEHKNGPQKTLALKSWIFSLKSWRLLLELGSPLWRPEKKIMPVLIFLLKQIKIFFFCHQNPGPGS
jgi:hypothetical protein